MFLLSEKRYDNMSYNRCGLSGLKLPAISFGTWHNFGDNDNFENMNNLIFTAFDLGITHFDLADRYGLPIGSAEENMGKILKDLKPYRDELIISTKAGTAVWDGPYGDWGGRKHMIASLDRSLKRLGLEYVDIFYHHRADPETPLEETMAALAYTVSSGKALYVGISNYSPELSERAFEILKRMGTPCLIHQHPYSMLNRKAENGLFETLSNGGVGSIAFIPLAQGVLTDRYLKGIPSDSRAANPDSFLKSDNITPDVIEKVQKLNKIAKDRGQSLAQMALAWVLKDGKVASALIGASKPQQIKDNVAALSNLNFSSDELQAIETILK